MFVAGEVAKFGGHDQFDMQRDRHKKSDMQNNLYQTTPLLYAKLGSVR